MQACMYIFVNDGAKMSRGKLGAQTAHAAIDAVGVSKQEMIDAWYVGHHTAKVVLHADDAEHLNNIERYISDRGFATSLVIDEGRTEVGSFTPTALGVEIVDKDDPHTKATFEHFQLLKDPKPAQRDPEESQTKGPFIDELMSFVSNVCSDPNTSIDTLLEIRKLATQRSSRR